MVVTDLVLTLMRREIEAEDEPLQSEPRRSP